ncbi:twin-arginine translocase TatA/TatE family subunit [Deinococcus sp. MIMF12]|uniref:Sec-independent protein translocase protein TatA n=1 Tax=Deinococcus rhizophilus TaxID=3049544 RepID=A0ABT7JEN3_9DEIO|nr:twin-arginine translocase TatA/TatE family subunit [Deinococcus rhizophilus]MDL2343510.1 twin-arginine translocase TatA/TatE family subunit [Deinococcus rhizophilus]
MPGPMELILILLVVALIFGAKKLPELGKGLGQGIREFKKETHHPVPLQQATTPLSDVAVTDVEARPLDAAPAPAAPAAPVTPATAAAERDHRA